MAPSPLLSTNRASPNWSLLEERGPAANCSSFWNTPSYVSKFQTPTGNPGSSQLPLIFKWPEIVPCVLGVYPGISNTLLRFLDQFNCVFHLNGPVSASAPSAISNPLFSRLPMFLNIDVNPVELGVLIFHNKSVVFL